MIKEIYVDNFKSLKEFRLRLKKGVNVLVGPNGSGKSNIISFFDFISTLPNSELASAISAAGGVGSIFRKIGADKFSEKITFHIFGSVPVNHSKHLAYKFSASIGISEETETVFYIHQRLQIRSRTVDTENEGEIPKPWDLDVEVNEKEDSTQRITIHQVKDKMQGSGRRKTRSAKTENRIKEILNDACLPEDSLLSAVRFLGQDYWHATSDILSAKYFNIIPSKVKQAEDGASEPFIRRDGSGLYATLFAIKKSPSEKNPGYYYRRHSFYSSDRVSLNKITEYVKLANQSIQSIDVENSPFDNQLQIKIKIDQGDNKCTLPLSAMSDGTVKWITFVTLLLSRRSLFAVEEPENYLHPLMQSELIRLMRNIQEGSNQIIISTHSETILNALRPEEIIIVSLKDGSTVASWPENAQDVREEIQTTGFGLGYYYISGGLS